jgi:hypothetical protein
MLIVIIQVMIRTAIQAGAVAEGDGVPLDDAERLTDSVAEAEGVPVEEGVPEALAVEELLVVVDDDGVGDAVTSTMEATLPVLEKAPYSVLYSGPAKLRPMPPWYADEKVKVCCEPPCVLYDRDDVPPPL